MLKRPGIYAIYSPSGKFYIGSSYNCKKRVYEHMRVLKHGTHPNMILQNAYDKYRGKLTAKVLFVVPVDSLEYFEQRAIDLLKPKYNYSTSAISPARCPIIREKITKTIRSDRIRKLRSANAKAMWSSPAFKRKQSKKMKRLWENPEYREPLLVKRSLRAKDEEVRKRVADGVRLARQRPGVKEKHARTNSSKAVSRRRSLAQKAAHQRPETIKKRLKANSDPELRRKRSEQAKLQHQRLKAMGLRSLKFAKGVKIKVIEIEE